MGSTGDCSSGTCPVPNGFFSSPPTVTGSVVLLVAFALLTPFNIYTGVRDRTPLYTSPIVAGLLLEIMGYIGRILLGNDAASKTSFVVYMLGTMWGPALITSSIYMVPAHVMVIYGDEFSLVARPAYITVFFLAFNLLTLVIEAAGVALAANGTTATQANMGVDLLLVGLGMQVGSLVLFFIVHWYFSMRLSRRRNVLDRTHEETYFSPRFRNFLVCVQISAALFLLRTAARLAQFSGGLASSVAQSEPVSLALDGAVSVCACIFLAVISPGVAFGSAWEATSPFEPGTLPRGSRRTGPTAASNVTYQQTPQIPWFPPPPSETHQHGSAQRPRGSPRVRGTRTPTYQAPTYQRPPYEIPMSSVPYVASPRPGEGSRVLSPRHQTTSMVHDDSLW